MTDKETLMTGECLTASHISAANKLLEFQFPLQNGLLDTHYLLNKNQWDSNPSNFVQVIYVDPGHWACLSNIFAADGCVDLYDSVLTIPTEGGSIVQQACTIMKSLKLGSIKLNVINVRPQFGGTDCGLFAIAMATELCHSVDPVNVNYDQHKMRNYLASSFEDQALGQFPSSIRKGSSKRVVFTLDVDVYCICRQPERLPMVCCDTCDTWYHPDCIDVHIHAEVFDETRDTMWYCPSCKFFDIIIIIRTCPYSYM